MERGLISFGDLLTYMSDKLVTKLSYFQLTQYIFAFGYYSRMWGPDLEYIQNFSMCQVCFHSILDFAFNSIQKVKTDLNLRLK